MAKVQASQNFTRIVFLISKRGSISAQLFIAKGTLDYIQSIYRDPLMCLRKVMVPVTCFHLMIILKKFLVYFSKENSKYLTVLSNESLLL